METFRLLYIAIGPGIALAVYFYYSDKWEPEPKMMVVKSFLLGGLACFPTSYYEGAFEVAFGFQGMWDPVVRFQWWQTAFYAFFGVALAEELCKFLFLKGFIYEDREFNEPFDGIVYGAVMGCGFATVENIFYVFENGYGTGVLRMLTAVPGHAFDGVILGYFMGKAKFSPEPEKNLTKGLVLVIILHGAYDTAAFSNLSWSIYPVFAIGILGMYLGLKAKKDLEKQSELVESSSKEFILLKEDDSYRPLTIRDIRDYFSDGKLEMEDVFFDKESGEKKTVREILYSGVDTEYKALIKKPRGEQDIRQFLLFYGLTFGLYLYFWYLRNYRDLKNYRSLEINPELRALALFVFSTVPFFIYGTFLETLRQPPFEDVSEIIFNLMMAGIETGFIFFQLRMLKGFFEKRLKKSFPLLTIVLMFFVLSGLRKFLPSDISFFWLYEIVMILIQGGVLAVVQKDLNLYWRCETNELSDPTCRWVYLNSIIF